MQSEMFDKNILKPKACRCKRRKKNIVVPRVGASFRPLFGVGEGRQEDRRDMQKTPNGSIPLVSQRPPTSLNCRQGHSCMQPRVELA